ncbi:MAG: MotA/TolQ/ExbB proton channel family protein [Kiritimatiellia bacterium]
MRFFLEGGVLLWIIVALSLTALVIFVDRLLRLRKIGIDPQDFLQGVFNVLDKGQVDEALAICDETPGPVPALVSEAIAHRDSDEINLREILAATAHAEMSRLERRSMLLSLFAQLLPLLGLIGTFCGGYVALTTLDAQAPLVQTGDLVGAVAASLITTIAGLVGAAGCYVAHHVLLLRINALSLEMDTSVSLMLDYLARCPEGEAVNG